ERGGRADGGGDECLHGGGHAADAGATASVEVGHPDAPQTAQRAGEPTRERVPAAAALALELSGGQVDAESAEGAGERPVERLACGGAGTLELALEVAVESPGVGDDVDLGGRKGHGTPHLRVRCPAHTPAARSGR